MLDKVVLGQPIEELLRHIHLLEIVLPPRNFFNKVTDATLEGFQFAAPLILVAGYYRRFSCLPTSAHLASQGTYLPEC